jgi:hypothetical protein
VRPEGGVVGSQKSGITEFLRCRDERTGQLTMETTTATCEFK